MGIGQFLSSMKKYVTMSYYIYCVFNFKMCTFYAAVDNDGEGGSHRVNASLSGIWIVPFSLWQALLIFYLTMKSKVVNSLTGRLSLSFHFTWQGKVKLFDYDS